MIAGGGLLLGLQYRWLTNLAETSAVAETAALSNYLDTVSTKVESHYSTTAEKVLYMPADFFLDAPVDKIAYAFSRKEPPGVKLIFAIKYTDEEWSRISAYDPRSGEIGEPSDPSLVRAIQVASAPMKILASKEASLRDTSLSTDVRDPENRIILQPITLGDNCKVIGVAGLVVDNAFFIDSVLSSILTRAIPGDAGLTVTVRDDKGRVVTGGLAEDGALEGAVGRDLPFIYPDWEIAIGRYDNSPEQVAKANFLLNMTMSFLLAFLLIGGLVFALQSASRQVKLSQMKADFVSNVSHELRTPLASIRVFGEFLRLGRVDTADKAKEYGEYIETESRRLTGLVNNILDFAKIESGAKTYQFERTDLAAVVDESVRTLGISLRHQGFELDYENRAETLPPLRIDASALTQALANLVDNAVKYSGDQRKIAIRLTHDAERVTIAVRDHGIGITRDEQKKIFERFHRVSTGLVHEVRGAGLGLSIVDHVIKAHGGRVWVESEPGQGSEFRLELPIERENPSADEVAMPGSVPA